MHFTSDGWSIPDTTPDIDVRAMQVDVPTSTDVLPDGQPTIVIGDVAGYAELNHKQGENLRNFEGTCGICSCESILNRFGIEVTEAELVEHAVANNECLIHNDLRYAGGTTRDHQIRILADYGLPAHEERGRSLGDLATDIEQGRGVIISGNAGFLWNDVGAWEFGRANHAVVVTAVSRDPDGGQIQGFYINDSGTGESGKFVDANTMALAWVDTGGRCVVTDVVRRS